MNYATNLKNKRQYLRTRIASPILEDFQKWGQLIKQEKKQKNFFPS